MDEMFTIDETAAMCKVSRRTIQRAITNGHLEAHRLGEQNGLRILAASIEAWLEVRSTLHEPRAVKPIPVLPPIGDRPSRRRPRAAGSLDVFGDRRAA